MLLAHRESTEGLVTATPSLPLPSPFPSSLPSPPPTPPPPRPPLPGERLHTSGAYAPDTQGKCSTPSPPPFLPFSSPLSSPPPPPLPMYLVRGSTLQGPMPPTHRESAEGLVTAVIAVVTVVTHQGVRHVRHAVRAREGRREVTVRLAHPAPRDAPRQYDVITL